MPDGSPSIKNWLRTALRQKNWLRTAARQKTNRQILSFRVSQIALWTSWINAPTKQKIGRMENFRVGGRTDFFFE